MAIRLMAASLLVVVLAACGSSSTNSSPSNSSNVTSPSGINHVHSIAVLPNDPNAIYLGAHYRMYRSTDGGKTWKPLIRQMMLSIAVDPSRPATMYAISSKQGMLKTTDGGTHWKSAGAGLPSGQITGVVFDPAAHAPLAYGVGVYRGTGTTWHKILSKLSVDGLATGGSTLYAAAGTGLFVSTDAGGHWARAKSIGNQPVVQVAASGHTSYAAAAIGLFKSVNDGRTWTLLAGAPAGIEFIGVSPSNPSEVFGEIGGRGFTVSHDGGTTWHAANKGITDRNFNASVVRVSPSSPNVVYTGAWGLHFYASRDGGRHWVKTATLTK